ncbi:type VII secretion protein EccB [Micromonospora radicis]|uniref:Type VII secretion protein EccB n=1 Tax=Micromonospora radicis TaxID=1894971 RepID=A0A418MQR3_9ACTN|nr:type VII secretion protein EccB [Micromonospora radicis]RIV36056.1 type VII secretion protein EccB [Micromonospora radicis]
MQSRRDQAQAQSYMVGRLTAALVMGEPEALENPHRRMLTGILAGLLIGCLVTGGFVVYGLLRPGGATGWQKPGTLIAEKESGGRFILVDGQLRPVHNYASAALIFGGRPAVVRASAASLNEVPRGLPLGIVGAPDSLPPVDGLAGISWSACALGRAGGAGSPGTGTMLILSADDGGTPVRADAGFTVAAPDGRTFLVTEGRRMALTEPWIPRVLGYPAAPTIAPGWLDQLPAGPDVKPIVVADRGEPGPVVDGRPTRIGQVFVARVVGTPDRYFVLQRDGLSAAGETAVALLLGDPATSAAYPDEPVRPRELTAGALAALPVSNRDPLPAGLPTRPPVPVTPPTGQTWCAERHTPDGPVTVTTRPVPNGIVPGDTPGFDRTAHTAVAVWVDPGTGGLVRQGRPGQANGTSFFLVTDAGVKYPIASADAAEALGYPLAAARTVPAPLLALLATGPLLDPAAARR